MGYTHFTVEKLEEIIKERNPKSILDFGAQNMYNQAEDPAPYAKEWYESKGIKYVSVDINSEHGSIPLNLSNPLSEQLELSEELTKQYDLVVDAGTTEHVGVDGKHNVEAFYNAWKTKYDLCKVGGVIYSENPKTGSWPGHGFNYHTMTFYHQLITLLGLTETLQMNEHAACHNVIDGWNVYCSFIKPNREFISLEQFKTLDFKLS